MPLRRLIGHVAGLLPGQWEVGLGGKSGGGGATVGEEGGIE